MRQSHEISWMCEWRERNQLRNSSANYTHLEYTALIVLIKLFNTEHAVPCITTPILPGPLLQSRHKVSLTFLQEHHIYHSSSGEQGGLECAFSNKKSENGKKSWSGSTASPQAGLTACQISGRRQVCYSSLSTLGTSHFHCQLYIKVAQLNEKWILLKAHRIKFGDLLDTCKVPWCINRIYILPEESNLSHLNKLSHFSKTLLPWLVLDPFARPRPYRSWPGFLFCERFDTLLNEEKASAGYSWEQLQKWKKTAYSLKWRQMNQAGWLPSLLIPLK